MYVCVLSGFSHVQFFATLWTIAHQALCIEFPRQEYWSGLPFPISGDLLTQESNQCLLHCRQTLPTEPPGKSYVIYTCGLKIIIQRYERIYRNIEISVFAQIVLITWFVSSSRDPLPIYENISLNFLPDTNGS